MLSFSFGLMRFFAGSGFVEPDDDNEKVAESPYTPTAVAELKDEVINPVLGDRSTEISKEPGFDLSTMESQEAQRDAYSVVINALHSSDADKSSKEAAIHLPTAGSDTYQPISNASHPSPLPPGCLHHHYHRHHPHKLRWENIPWMEMFTNPASLALLLNSFAQGWVGLIILTEMPTFLNQQLG
jgi:hypothetical protein